jgi:hypothetical protein
MFTRLSSLSDLKMGVTACDLTCSSACLRVLHGFELPYRTLEHELLQANILSPTGCSGGAIGDQTRAAAKNTPQEYLIITIILYIGTLPAYMNTVTL